MKHIALLSLAVMASLAVANSAFALSFSVDVPYQFTLDNKIMDTQKSITLKNQDSTKAKGFILGASAGWLGVGYEKYDVDGKATTLGFPFDFTLTYQFYDVFLDLPFPVIHPVIGYGKGTVFLATDGLPSGLGAHIEPGDASQTFARVGIPIGPLFDLHLGYHVVTVADAKFKNSTGDKLKTSGEMWTVGARLGW
ncbi:MAG TPA: hypothetical protein VF678_02915 [bacterium]